jgi:thiol-disulfide isomerase/thioredoxin
MSARLARRSAPAPLAVLAAVLLAGCARSPQPGESTEVGVRVIDKAGYVEAIERSRGNVVLVDFWATWCDPCMKLFPHTVELHKRFAGQGLTVISVSLDDPDDKLPQVVEFLGKQNATFANFISRYGGGTESVEAFELGGALPQLKLYDRQGKLHRSFGGDDEEVDTQQLDRALEALLGER